MGTASSSGPPKAIVQGATEAFLTGALAGLGLALYNDDDYKRGRNRVLGLGCVSLSLFVWYCTSGMRNGSR